MILPAFDCQKIVKINRKIGVQLQTTSEGTLFRLWSYARNKPIKNGKIAMLTKYGRLRFFRDVTPRFCNITKVSKRIKYSVGH
jgi:hypothetical protein